MGARLVLQIAVFQTLQGMGSSPADPPVLKMMEPWSYGVFPFWFAGVQSCNTKPYIYSQHTKCLLLANLCLKYSLKKKVTFLFLYAWGNPGHKYCLKTRKIYFNSRLNIFSLARYGGI